MRILKDCHRAWPDFSLKNATQAKCIGVFQCLTLYYRSKFWEERKEL